MFNDVAAEQCNSELEFLKLFIEKAEAAIAKSNIEELQLYIKYYNDNFEKWYLNSPIEYSVYTKKDIQDAIRDNFAIIIGTNKVFMMYGKTALEKYKNIIEPLNISIDCIGKIVIYICNREEDIDGNISTISYTDLIDGFLNYIKDKKTDNPYIYIDRITATEELNTIYEKS